MRAVPVPGWRSLVLTGLFVAYLLQHYDAQARTLDLFGSTLQMGENETRGRRDDERRTSAPRPGGALQAGERTVIAGVLALIALLAGLDLIVDLRQGVSLWHVLAEARWPSRACFGVFHLLRGVWRLRRRLDAQDRDFVAFRQQAEAWRTGSNKYLQGLSHSIGLQLDQWQLSAAEKEVAFLLLKGLSLKEIAAARGTTEKTARVQSSAIYTKSGPRWPFRALSVLPGRLASAGARNDSAPRAASHHRAGWLRAAVLGANDGIVSTASLIFGVAAAGAIRMPARGRRGGSGRRRHVHGGGRICFGQFAVGPRAGRPRPRAPELATDPEHEHAEMAAIYVGAGSTPQLAPQVATQLMAHDALGAHARDELGISDMVAARPVQASLASAGSFSVGAALPLLVVMLSANSPLMMYWVAGSALFSLAALGALSARAGGSPMLAAAGRVAASGACSRWR